VPDGRRAQPLGIISCNSLAHGKMCCLMEHAVPNDGAKVARLFEPVNSGPVSEPGPKADAVRRC